MRFHHRLFAHLCAVLCLAVPPVGFGQSTCAPFGAIALDGGVYNFQMNEFDSRNQECATTRGIGFNITAAEFGNGTNGAPGAYTSLYRGCHWGSCTSSNPFPIQESNLASASTSVALTQPSGYSNDAAYDIWFNQTSTTSGQPNGTEIMIWLNHQGSVQPFGSQTGTATIDNAQFEVWTGNQSSWRIVSYVAAAPVHSVTHLNLLPFFEDAVSRGSLEPSWWLIDVEFGFEIWNGGKDLAVSNFSVSAAAETGGSCGQVPSPPSGLRGAAASSRVINLSWTADTAPANCTIHGYDIYRSTTSGFKPSSGNRIANGVTATSYSDTGLSPATTYSYAVAAADAYGTSSSSAQASATTAAAASGGGGCHVAYTIVNQWAGGFQAAITLENTSAAPWTHWMLTWDFANGQTLTNLWNGTASQQGGALAVNSLSYNGGVAAGGSYSGIGFTATWNNATNPPPASFAVNGTTCQ